MISIILSRLFMRTQLTNHIRIPFMFIGCVKYNLRQLKAPLQTSVGIDAEKWQHAKLLSDLIYIILSPCVFFFFLVFLFQEEICAILMSGSNTKGNFVLLIPLNLNRTADFWQMKSVFFSNKIWLLSN